MGFVAYCLKTTVPGKTARRSAQFCFWSCLTLRLQYDLHCALPAEGHGQQRLQAGEATHTGAPSSQRMQKFQFIR